MIPPAFVLIGWLVVPPALFVLLPKHRAVVAGFLIPVMFLPYYEIDLPSLPPFSKNAAAAYGLLFAVLLFDAPRFLTLRPKWTDIPVVVLCLSPGLASITNGLGPYDAVSAIVDTTFRWGLTYLVGRLYLPSPGATRELALGVLLGGLVYVPFCLLEIQLSPQLHRWVYGFHPQAFGQQIRFGGYRPVVFFKHGLQVALFMATATLIGFGLWVLAKQRTFFGLPMPLLVAGMIVMTVLCKTIGALLFLAIGMGAILAIRFGPVRARPLVLVALALVPVAYVSVRAPGIYTGDSLVATARTAFGSDRAASLETRITNENRIAARAMQKPLFGWGRWGRYRPKDDEGRDITTSDGQWIIMLGEKGLLGMGAFMGMVLLPALVLYKRIPPAYWASPAGAPAAIVAVVLLLWLIYNIPNNNHTPIFMLMAAALAGMPKVVPVRRRIVRPGGTGTDSITDVTEVPLGPSGRPRPSPRQRRGGAKKPKPATANTPST